MQQGYGSGCSGSIGEKLFNNADLLRWRLRHGHLLLRRRESERWIWNGPLKRHSLSETTRNDVMIPSIPAVMTITTPTVGFEIKRA
jgi:hypothetical protein